MVLKQVSKRYGDVVAVAGVDLDIREGEFLTLLGPSGCGKMTTLRMVAGFILPSSGTVLLGDEDVTRLPPNRRDIGMVFQDYALFPHMTIAENIAFGLVERRVDRAEIDRRVKELLELVRLANVAQRYPPELSGGQQQRIAVARAVAYSPKVLLMDEPLGALDLKLREAMQIGIRQIQQQLGMTTVYVTHDQTEAMHMSDRIVVMNNGAIEQLGTAEEIYNRPATRFVADFIGQINLLDAAIVGREGEFAVADISGVRQRVLAPPEVSGPVAIGLRPQHLTVMAADSAGADRNLLKGRILGRTYSGNLVHVDVELDGGQRATVDAAPETAFAGAGAPVVLGWRPERANVLAR